MHLVHTLGILTFTETIIFFWWHYSVAAQFKKDICPNIITLNNQIGITKIRPLLKLLQSIYSNPLPKSVPLPEEGKKKKKRP